MKRNILCFLLFQLLWSSSESQVLEQDSLALVDLYYNTDGNNWNYNDNWLTGPVNSWIGITLTTDGTRVKEIDLFNNNLTETLPNSFWNLDHLTHIEFGVNDLHGSIPVSIGNFEDLVDLGLVYNHFIGEIPLSIGNLPQLILLHLEYNEFSGTFPYTMVNGIIHDIGISYNHFTFFPDFSIAPTLEGLTVDNNSLQFNHIEPNITFLLNFSPYYSPQDSVLNSIDTTVLQGSTLVLHSKVGGTANLYLWNKDSLDIPGSIDTILNLNNISFADSGVYTCNINNSIVNGLTLHRRKIFVHVADTTTYANQPVKIVDPVKIVYHPQDNSLYLDFQFSSKTRTRAAVYNIQGQKAMQLIQGDIVSRNLVYHLDQLKPGLYLVKVEAGKQVVTKKIVICN